MGPWLAFRRFIASIWTTYFLSSVRIYTAHKKFMNGVACRGFDPYVAIISTSRCQKTPVCKSAK